MEGQIVVSEEIGALTSEDVGLVECLIKLKSYREVFKGLVQDAQASKCPSSRQMELACRLLFFSDRDVKVLYRLIKVVQLKVQKSSEKVQTRLSLLLAAAMYGDVHEF